MCNTSRLFAICVAISCVAGMQRASAAPFVIDSSQSYLSIAIGAIDTEQDPPAFISFTTPQVLGSDSTSLSGTIQATITGTTITFNGGWFSFDNQPGPMEPGLGGVLPGSAAANYGLNIDLQSLVVGPGAARDMKGEATAAAQPIIGGTFDSSGMMLAITQGVLDANLTGFATVQDSIDIAGNDGINLDPNGLIEVLGGLATVTIPVHVEANVPVVVSGFVIPLVAVFDGQIVATGLVPEPGTWVLASSGLLGLATVGYRRRRRSTLAR